LPFVAEARMSGAARGVPPELGQFIEDMGLRYEEEGFPRMAGRLTGWLLVCDPPHQSAGELADVLGASPSSISSVTRFLVQCGLVERIGVPGERSARFRIRPGAWSEIMAGWLQKTRKMRELAEHGLELLAGRPPEVRTRLVELRDFHRFMEQGLPHLFDDWRRGRRA
jgi:DNA-binding transcriptional regulator GbsR (MarR family)